MRKPRKVRKERCYIVEIHNVEEVDIAGMSLVCADVTVDYFSKVSRMVYSFLSMEAYRSAKSKGYFTVAESEE